MGLFQISITCLVRDVGGLRLSWSCATMFKDCRIPVGPLRVGVLLLVAALSSKSNSEKWEIWLSAHGAQCKCESVQAVLFPWLERQLGRDSIVGFLLSRGHGVPAQAKAWAQLLPCSNTYPPQILPLGKLKRAGRTCHWELEASQQHQGKDNRTLLICLNVISFFLHLSHLSVFPLQALSILLLPRNIPSSLNLLTSMIDDIWQYAGDQSTDVSPGALQTGWCYPSAPEQIDGLKQALGHVSLEMIPLLNEKDICRSTQGSFPTSFKRQ